MSVRKLVVDKRKLSPLFWSYRLKHVASDSLVCTALFDDKAPDNQEYEDDELVTNATAFAEVMKSLSESAVRCQNVNVYGSLICSLTPPLPAPENLKDDASFLSQTNHIMWALGKNHRNMFLWLGHCD